MTTGEWWRTMFAVAITFMCTMIIMHTLYLVL